MYRCILAGFMVALLATNAFGTIVFVDKNTPAAQGDQVGNYWDSAFDTLAEGVNRAIIEGPGTEVYVAYGEYTEARTSIPRAHTTNCGALVISNGIRVIGGYDPVTGVRDSEGRLTTIDGTTALDGGHALHTVMIDGDGEIENCRIIGGVSAGVDNPTGYGAGLLVYYGNATITNCFFYDNQSNSSGGACALIQSSVDINDCDFNMNGARENGGALYMVDSIVSIESGTTFYQNEAGVLGGAIAKIAGTLNVTRTNFVENRAQHGGAANLAGNDFAFLYCVLNGNIANGAGGAAVASDCAGEFVNCLITGNTAGERGAALTTVNADATITNCTLSANTGTPAAPDGAGGIYARTAGTVTLRNSILWGDTAPEWISVDDAVILQTFCNVQGGPTGDGNINQDPLFALSGSYFLKIVGPEVSPCIDSGTGNQAPTNSLMNVMRPTGSGIDMGAYEMATTQETVALEVSITGNGWTSPAPGYHRFYRGSTVELVAGAGVGANFVHWDGDLTATDLTTSITLDADSAVEAVFTGADPEGQPAEGQPAEGQTPAEGQPAEGQPAEGQTPAEGQPAEGQAAEGQTPAEGQPAEGQPAEGQTPAEGQAAEGQQQNNTSSGGCFGGTTSTGAGSSGGSALILLSVCALIAFSGKRGSRKSVEA